MDASLEFLAFHLFSESEGAVHPRGFSCSEVPSESHLFWKDSMMVNFMCQNWVGQIFGETWV